MGFGPDGWGWSMLRAAAMTLSVAIGGYVIGVVLGCIAAAASFSGLVPVRSVAGAYSTVMRGVPDILVIYLFYFGSGQFLAALADLAGHDGFITIPAFVVGILAIGVVSGAYQMQVFRGAVLALNKGEIEAGRACGMGPALLFRRVVMPQALRFAVPGAGNVWQLVLKESALISVIGLVELMRQAQIGAGSTRQPFSFFLTAAALYLLITAASGRIFAWLELRAMRGVRRAA
ncbi:ABC transporter permease subunit [Paracoccus aestuariivivens]|uniref:ABC transporter permease subunit n=2 Tax=Paracoccus aestuariivivens TaxID=1820333 RepID=A0A6L6JAZ5_9RHOB|nr:ABC transporter permease subunit [Paracoccus aestuariivivens]